VLDLAEGALHVGERSARERQVVRALEQRVVRELEVAHLERRFGDPAQRLGQRASRAQPAIHERVQEIARARRVEGIR